MTENENRIQEVKNLLRSCREALAYHKEFRDTDDVEVITNQIRSLERELLVAGEREI